MGTAVTEQQKQVFEQEKKEYFPGCYVPCVRKCHLDGQFHPLWSFCFRAHSRRPLRAVERAHTVSKWGTVDTGVPGDHLCSGTRSSQTLPQYQFSIFPVWLSAPSQKINTVYGFAASLLCVFFFNLF